MAGRKEPVSFLEARIEDHLAKAARGRIAVSAFLTPGERRQAERFLQMTGAVDRAVFWGGYAGAERVCLFAVPDFYAELSECMMPESGDPTAPLPIEAHERIQAVRIKGSGYRTLAHRDYLGSLLGLGIERDAMGDIAVQNEHEAVVFCTESMAQFLEQSLCKVASDTVKCSRYRMEEGFTDGKRYKPISDTVASPRLDCVVAALTNLSREDAQNAIRSGLVEVEFEQEMRTDRQLVPPATVSVRGFGRYILRSFDGETKKGRLRMRADQLI